MNESIPTRSRTSLAVFKVLYLLFVTLITFALPAVEAVRTLRWYVMPALLAIQVVILLHFGVSLRDVFRAVWRLKWLFAFLLACYAFLPGDDRHTEEQWRQMPLPLISWAVWVNVGGLSHAALMCLQILTVILASAVVRLTGSGTDMVDGLRALRLPALFVHALDQTLGQLGGLRRAGSGGGGGTGGGRAGRGAHGAEGAGAASSTPGFFPFLRRLLSGDVGFFTQAIRSNLERARDQVQQDSGGKMDEPLAHDVAIITGVALVMVSLKMLKALPGIPFASGHKTLLFFPLYVLASRLTHTRWGGTVAGAVMGVVGFLQGDGRFGVLEVFKHLAPGLLIDLLMPVVKRLPQTVVVYCIVGFLAAIARTATEIIVVLLLGARAEVYVFPAARLVPNLIAGTLSGFVTVFVLRAFLPDLPHAPGPRQAQPSDNREPELVASHPPSSADGGTMEEG